MRHYDDEPMYRTFEEFEREELRRASIDSTVDELFDGMLSEDLDFSTPPTRRPAREIDPDEEE